MSISSVKTGAVGVSLLAGNTGYDPAATFLIARANGDGSSGTITFSSIPSTYQHLQLRYHVLTSSNGSGLQLLVNSDTGANYARHQLVCDGSTVSAFGAANVNAWYVEPSGNATNTTQPSVGIIDFHDYASTSKNKTMRAFVGVDINGTGGSVALRSAVWLSTSAINAITINANAGVNFSTSSTFALYGMVG